MHVGGIYLIGPMAFDRIKPCLRCGVNGLGKGAIIPEKTKICRKAHVTTLFKNCGV
jgi:uncharacterized protein YcbX